MNEQRFETGNAPHVVVAACGGALVIGSWQGTAVLAQSTQLSANTPNPDQLELVSDGDLTLTVPEKASITIKNCTGAMTIKHVDGFVTVDTAVQSITLNNVGSAKIGSAGVLQAENINGPLNVGQMQAVKLRNVADVVIAEATDNVAIHFATGAVDLGKVDGRITLHTINGPVTIRQAREAQLGNLGGLNQVSGIGGDLWLIGGLSNGEHSFQAEGNIYAAWPVDAPLTLVAKAAVIDNQLLLSNAAVTTLDDGRTQLTGHIEQGKPFVAIKTMGNMGLKPLRLGETTVLTATDFDFSVPQPLVVEEAIITPPVPSPGLVKAAKAQEKTEKSLQKAADSIVEAKTRLTQSPPTQPEPAQPEPESELETTPETAVTPSQTQILKLLKDDLITVEQANLLLDNLRDA